MTVGSRTLAAALALTAWGGALAGAGCGGDTPAASSSGPRAARAVPELAARVPPSLRSRGQIVVGVNAIFPPMEYKAPDSNTLVGFDIDFTRAIGETLGVEVVFEDQQFDQLITSITTGRVDMVVSSLSDTRVRQETLDFIDYFNTGTQAYTTRALADEVTGLESLSGKVLAVSSATDYRTTMEQWSRDHLEAKGRLGIRILAVDSEATARLQMVQGRAQASAISPEVLGWLEAQSPGQFVPIGPILNPGPYGICLSKGSAQLRDVVLAAVQHLFDNGTYQALLDRWQLGRSAIASPVVNGARN